ncbi:MAG: PAS domain S-box protein [Methanospirillaceae archaeon]|nr:PAS domain S-box protein [Methanospirillaceae archaeon]
MNRKGFSMQNKGLAFVIIGSMLLFGVLFWIADSVLWFYLYKYNLQFMVFEMPESIFDTLFYNISKHALFVRITFLIACFLTGFLIYTYIKTRNDALRKATHVNNLLRSLIAIRKLIAQEHDRDMLPEKVCESLTTHGGFISAWIFTGDSDRIIHSPCKQETNILLEEFIAQVQSGDIPPCASGVTATETTVIYHHDRCIREGCKVALFDRGKQSVFSRRLVSKDGSFGILYAVAPSGVPDLKEELTIFDEIADDLANALYAISREEVIVSVAKDRDHREAIVETISYIAGKFLPETDFKENINDIFSRLGGLLGYNSILLFKNEIDENGTLAGYLQESWNNETKISEDTGFDTIVIGYDPFITWEMDLSAGKDIIVLCSGMDENQKDRFSLLQSGSCILVPVFVGNNWWGVIACTDPDENRSWSHVDRLACNVTGALIGAALTREKMSQSVKRTQERYYDLFNRISQSILVFDISKKNDFSPISEVNETCCETFGYSRNELYKKTISDLMMLSGDELLRYHADQLYDTPTLTFETDFIRHDSSVFSGEMTLHLMHDDGKTRILTVIRDITERKKAEMEIIASELRYRQLFESAGTPILVLHNSEIFDCNYQASLLFGKYPFELYESSFLDYAPEYQPDGMRSI